MTSSGGTIVWLRQDLRLQDNPALHAAAARREPVIPLYILSPDEEGAWAPGAAQRWWLNQSLQALDRQLRTLGSRLTLAKGPALQALLAVAGVTGARAVHWSERYEPEAASVGRAIAADLHAAGIETRQFNSALLVEPGQLRNNQGGPYQRYSAFQRALLQRADPGRPLPAPAALQPPRFWPESLSLASLCLLPEVDWYQKLAACWSPGESGAHRRLDQFLKTRLTGYGAKRDIPSANGTSRLSPHLHFGEIGPRQIWHALSGRRGGLGTRFVGELAWREFSYHMLRHFPFLTDQPLRAEFARFPWRRDDARLRSWQKGLTGMPLVDAGMRELWATGWMHNRVRMVTASFLVKNLMVPWQDGARWFWDTLVDADLANNTLNWQWVAGCGVDAAPFFRIFNPRTQAERFDAKGGYVRRWVPELGMAGERHYPAPIVDWKESRAEALEAYAGLRRAAHGREERPR